MDWKTFFASETKSLAWPIVACIFLYLIRKQVGALVAALGNRITKAEIAGVKLEFGEQVENARKAEEQLLIASKSDHPLQLELAEKGEARDTVDAQVIPADPLAKLAKEFPEAAVLQAFDNVVDVLIFETTWAEDTEAGVDWSKPESGLIQIARNLQQQRLIDGLTVDLFVRASDLRNMAVHAGSAQTISVGEAIEYIRICRTLTAAFKRAFAKYQARRGPGDEAEPA